MRLAASKRTTAGLLILAMFTASGCGYFLYPERVGQTEGRLDPAVVALDAAGLLFGIIPGVIAFAVDITTGTIYLPEGEENVIEKHQERLSSLESLSLRPIDDADVNIDEQLLAKKLAGNIDDSVELDQVQYFEAEQAGLLWLREL